MTFTEIMSIVIGGFLGYWIIDSLINRAPKAGSQDYSEQNTKSDTHKTEAESIEERWFKILEVSRDASKEQIIAAYKKKISQYHPDKVSSLGVDLKKLAEEKSKEINAAYDYAMVIKS